MSKERDPFQFDYINPKTNLPYRVSPGKSRTRPVDTMLDEVPDFQLVPENIWTQIDAKTLGMTPQNAIALQEYSQEAFKSGDAIYGKPATGTDTGRGDREVPPPTSDEEEAPAPPAPVKRTAADVVKGFGNDFGSMESQGLASALQGAQESIIQKRMDAGADFGFQTTASTPLTTSDPGNPQDGVSSVADLTDQSRAIDFPQYNPEQFKTDFINSKLGGLLTDINMKGLREVDFDKYK